MLNRVVLTGRTVRDCELRYSQTGKGIGNFTLAVDRNYGEKKETDFIRCVCFGKVAESCGQYLTKGKLAGVDGRLQVRNYEDKDGNKRTIAEVVADRVEFLSPKDGGQKDNDGFHGTFYGGLDEGDPPF